MQKILRKRMFRDLKENRFRYLALGLLIILGMYIVISLVGAADTIIIETAETAKENRVEDGQFGVFVPLTEGEKSALEEEGMTLEEHFYMDYSLAEKEIRPKAGGSPESADAAEGFILRIFPQREKIDLVQVDSGRLPEKEGEILLERRFCEEQELHAGDKIKVGSLEFTVAGIGTAPDYESPLRSLSDSAVDSTQFGVGFVTAGDYEQMREVGGSISSEEYTYAYLLNDRMTDERLKEKLKGMEVSADDIDDVFFQEYWERTGGKTEGFRDALDELTDGAVRLSEGLAGLDKNSGRLNAASSDIFFSFLEESSESLAELGVPELTADHYEAVLQSLIEGSDNALMRMKLKSVLKQLQELQEFETGVKDYTGGVSEANEGAEELCVGSRELRDETKEFLDENVSVSLSKMTRFTPAGDNPRIGSAGNDKFVDKAAGLAAGVIVLILFAYVISVFTVHSIERESGVIGTLYAMGVKRKELLRHYLTLPVILTFTAGAIGTGLGYSSIGVSAQMSEPYGYFSIPRVDVVYEPYLLIYGLLLPPLAAALTNFLVIRKKLDQPVLAMLRGEQKKDRVHAIRLTGGFVRVFRIRQLLREMRTVVTVFFGMFISLLIVMLSLDCYAICSNIKKDNARDTRFAYMYTCKYPEEEVPEGGEEAAGVTMKKEVLGYNFDITLLGIHEKNPYFDAPVEEGEERVLISSALAQKYGIGEGDTLTLLDEEKDRYYAFHVDGVVTCSTGFFAFMDIGSMRELMGESADYYNIVFSDHALDIDSGRLYSALSKEEVEKRAAVFVEQMKEMVITLLVVSALIFAVVMYLMMKVMIDRSALSVSLFKVFGYRKQEIRRLFLDGNFFVVTLSALVGIPLAKAVMDLLFPFMVSNVACGINLRFPWQMYVGVFLSVLVLYVGINGILMGRVNKILPAEVLKNRE